MNYATTAPITQTVAQATNPQLLRPLLEKYMGNQLAADMLLAACNFLEPTKSPLTRYRRLSPSTMEALISIPSLGLDFVWISTSISALHWELRCIHLLGGFENMYWVPWSKSLEEADTEYNQRRLTEAARHKGKIAHEEVRSELVRIFEGGSDSELSSSGTDSAEDTVDSEDEYWNSYDDYC
ncbi:hypothetical protein CJU89_0389 [Yarrowia sp. B02]|nr:hypothetical protein CJU89_0389 [Yarrowia sp. B02]